MSKEHVKVLCVGDPHFKRKNVNETNSMMTALVDVIKSKDPDFIVVLGDILDRHEIIHQSPLSRSVEFLNELRKYAPLYVLIGNHDLINNNVFLTDQHPFTALKYWDNVVVVDKPHYITTKGHTFTFVPYVYKGRFAEALSEEYIKDVWRDSSCIFAHQEFKGAKMGAIISDDGDEWPLSNPLVVSGHIHNYDRLQNNILYTGTPMQHAFGDREDKTISYFLFDEDGEFTEERIDLGVPKKVMLVVDYDDIDTTSIPEGCDVKVIIVGNTSQINTSDKLSKIKEWKKSGVKIAHRDISTIDLESVQIETTLKYEELMIKTINSLPPDQSEPILKLFARVCADVAT